MHAAADGDQRDAPAVHMLLPRMAFEDITLGSGANELRVPMAASLWILDPRAGHPPRRGRWGSGRARRHEFMPDRFAPGLAWPWAGRFLPFASAPAPAY